MNKPNQDQTDLLLRRAGIPKLYRHCTVPASAAWKEVAAWLEKWRATDGGRITQPIIVLFEGADKIEEYYALCAMLAQEMRSIVVTDTLALGGPPDEALDDRLGSDQVWAVSGMGDRRDAFIDTQLFRIERRLIQHINRCGMLIIHAERPLQETGREGKGWWSASFLRLVKKYLAIKA